MFTGDRKGRLLIMDFKELEAFKVLPPHLKANLEVDKFLVADWIRDDCGFTLPDYLNHGAGDESDYDAMDMLGASLKEELAQIKSNSLQDEASELRCSIPILQYIKKLEARIIALEARF
jgi:hypothetical protein